MFIIKGETLPQVFFQIDDLLSKVEVKGDSVQLLFNARAMLRKELFDKVEEIKQEEKAEGKEGG